MSLSLTIPGKPLGKQRPRVTKFGTYTPKDTVNYESVVRMLWIEKFEGPPISGPIEVEIFAAFLPPKSASKKRRLAMITDEIRPTGKPDWDNVGKIVCDALNGGAESEKEGDSND